MAIDGNPPEADVPLPFPAADALLSPIPCAICGRALTDAQGIALVRIQVIDERWTCASHAEERAF